MSGLQALDVQLDLGTRPAAESLCLLAPYGRDATGSAFAFTTDPRRTLCIDMLPGFDRHDMARLAFVFIERRQADLISAIEKLWRLT